MNMIVRVRAHPEYHHLPNGTLGVVRAWATHRRGVNGAIISMPDGRFDCVPIELLTLVSDAEQAAAVVHLTSRVAELERVIQHMVDAGGRQEFQLAFDLAKDALSST